MKTIEEFMDLCQELKESGNLDCKLGNFYIQIYGNSPLQVLVRNQEGRAFLKFTRSGNYRIVEPQRTNDRYSNSDVDYLQKILFSRDTRIIALRKMFPDKRMVQMFVAMLSEDVSEKKRRNVLVMNARHDLNQYLIDLLRDLGLSQGQVCQYISQELSITEESVKVMLYQRKELHKDLLDKCTLMSVVEGLVKEAYADARNHNRESGILERWSNKKKELNDWWVNVYVKKIEDIRKVEK